MKKRRLGRSSLEVAPLSFGGNVLGWTANEARSFELLDAFLAAGFNLIDTANTYSNWVPGNIGGESETIIGKWMKARGNRDKVIIATKLGQSEGPGKVGLARGYMHAAVEDSLRRLQTDYIDLYQAHDDDLETPIEETLSSFAELIAAGKVRYIGGSNFTAERFAESLRVSAAQGLPRYEALQPIYNLYDRSKFETQYADLVLGEGIGVINYYALAQGFLSGKYRSADDHKGKPRASRVGQRYMNDRGTRILDGLDAVAERTGHSPAQISLAWVLNRPGVTSPIVSATEVAQLEELEAVADIVLDEDSMATLEAASAY
jgi:aryl-alcohol dehydrogenase-like predicted oxidoreductase